jgi:hypothetical protein
VNTDGYAGFLAVAKNIGLTAGVDEPEGSGADQTIEKPSKQHGCSPHDRTQLGGDRRRRLLLLNGGKHFLLLRKSRESQEKTACLKKGTPF